MPALFFGSIGTLADTSELQREAFNRAFAQHGLDWSWDQDTYRGLLAKSGGADRVAEYAAERGDEVDADAVHQTKSEIFRTLLAESPAPLRAGVREAVEQAKAEGYKVAFVTTTDAANVEAILQTVEGLDAGDFDLIVDASQVDQAKPDPSVYAFALRELGEEAGGVIAVEDNVGGVEAANSAEVAVVAFPGENNAGHDFRKADTVVGALEFAHLASLVRAA
ncbi:HAD family phosphatase [Nocardioides sp.]|uniref:HAD family hydrolase n=1 Tax=Nocardioides sp. TaxID=35761 RepID=UPI00271FC0C2|nr:HAD-IA family hydrolase [Nocardioides sp.]MDO9457193.1 HAD-IA family hydrolase [Nocardioides sp.]